MSLKWRPQNWRNPHYPLVRDDMGYPKQSGLIRKEEFESGASAMLNALFELAKQSPTGKFEIDSTKVNR